MNRQHEQGLVEVEMMTMDMNRQHGESATEAHRQLKEAPAAEQYPVTVETTFAAPALQTCICLAANPPNSRWMGGMDDPETWALGDASGESGWHETPALVTREISKALQET